MILYILTYHVQWGPDLLIVFHSLIDFLPTFLILPPRNVLNNEGFPVATKTL